MTHTDALLENVRLVHGRDTCDEAGRPLTIYTCSYHEGFSDGLETGGLWANHPEMKETR